MPIDFKLDRTQFAAMSFDEAHKAFNDYKLNTAQERLEIANRLTAVAYNFPVGSPPAMDKTFFEAGNLQNRKYI